MPLLFGKPVSEKILSETREKIKGSGVVPGLGVVLVGDDPASRIYVGIKESRASELGFRFVKTELPVFATEADILDAVRKLNKDESVHGIIVQLPLPPGIDADRIITAIDPMKDADGFLLDEKNVTRTHGREMMLHSVPVFPEAMIELAKSSGVPFSEKSGVVLVNSERFGKTMVDALRQEGVQSEYVFSDDIGSSRSTISRADFVFTALGKPEALSKNMFKKGVVVIDGGIAPSDRKIVGDVSIDGSDENMFLSPVPGGVGPVTVACLLRRVVTLALENGKTAA
ncbi:MAG: bifunctional 5,10-methylenetetrahydrofolate dehydrogenase/5,10-methenyltetrahydrofolate cyclohydrolase [Candidatus Moranbacteria bacterium]|nr:bifunctional 5,10-methylenetetrahydrofolate dehydrogenase/5,10-methenyltetrahydrofolate cyclohydrolase [Candidatus Moranbacteria bacterium]